MNVSVINGNLTEDAIIREKNNLYSFSIAHNESKDRVSYFKCARYQVEDFKFAKTNLKKGQPVQITGRSANNNWIGKDGRKISEYLLIASNIELMGYVNKQKVNK